MKHSINWDEVLAIGSVKNIVQRLERFLTETLAGHSFGEYPRMNRVVKDAVWGIVSLSPQESQILDSPLLQRLRFVRQLGMSYLVYPTAGYSRFEHSLGAVHLVERFASAILDNARLRGEDGDIGDRLSKRLPLIRMAALLHDIGHGPFSHVSERFVESRDDEICDLVECFTDEIVGETIRLSELLSALLCLTEPLKSHLDALHLQEMSTPDCENSTAIASMILGVPPGNPENLFAAQIISSLCDVDKIDYMMRESHMSRLPLPLDVPRLFAKIHVKPVLAEDLPKDIGGDVECGTPIYILGLDRSGVGCLDEIFLSRVWLYDRLYLHHKTRAAEEVLMRAFEGWANQRGDGGSLLDLMLLTDSQLVRWEIGDDRAEPASLFTDICRRDLPVRFLAFGERFLRTRTNERHQSLDEQRNPRDTPLEASTRIWGEISKIFEPKSHDAKTDFLDAIRSEYLAIKQALPDIPELDGDRLFAASPGGNPGYKNTNLVLFGPDDSLETIMDHALFPPSQWSEAYTQRRATAYLFGPRNARSYLFIAAEAAFLRQFGAIFTDIAKHAAKVSSREVGEIKKHLREAGGYYVGDIVCLAGDRFTTVKEGNTLERLAGKLRYDRRPDGAARDPRVAVEHFLYQFPDPLAIEMAELLLEQGVIRTREDLAVSIVNSVKNVWREMGGTAENTLFLCPLGELRDSASHLTREVEAQTRQELGDQPWEVIYCTEIEGRAAGQHVVFFDDLLSSGQQATDIFTQAIETGNGGLGEKRDWRIEREALSSSQVGFAFAYAAEGGKDVFKKFWEETFEQTCCIAHDAPLEETLGKLANASPELRSFLTQVGIDLLTSTKGQENPEKWTEKRIAGCALGYGNSEGLLVFPYNAPTVTLTALWAMGQLSDGTQWLPLVVRREKK